MHLAHHLRQYIGARLRCLTMAGYVEGILVAVDRSTYQLQGAAGDAYNGSDGLLVCTFEETCTVEVVIPDPASVESVETASADQSETANNAEELTDEADTDGGRNVMNGSDVKEG